MKFFFVLFYIIRLGIFADKGEKMKHTKKIVFILMMAVMLSMCACGAAINSAAKDDFKAIWVATVYNLDYPSKPTANVATLKAEADKILKNCANMGMNAVILQVRPSADAFYKSSIFPWSKFLTGTPGKAPADGFDPLEYWVAKAHSMGIELHAWINPYRITKDGQAEFEKLSKDSPAVLHPDWVVQYTDGNYYLNPGIAEVREFIIRGAEEIVQNYDVDGLHLDDYFYPDTDFPDTETFAQFGEGYKNIEDWRRNNVNLLVRDLGVRLHEIDENISYGIAPLGVWANKSSIAGGSNTNAGQGYYKYAADSRAWIKNGWIDYICPQIYWEHGHDRADYETLAHWWADVVRGTGVKLYIGMADYKACDDTANSVWNGVSEIEKQLDLNKSIKEITGEVHFRYALMIKHPQIVELYKSRYAAPIAPEKPPVVAPTVSAQLDKNGKNPYMKGDEKGNFGPKKSLTRGEAVSMIARLVVDENGKALFENAKYTGGFKDVKATDWYASAVAFAVEHKIAAGYADGTFAPNKAITRAEFTRMITGFEKIKEVLYAPFDDVPADFWATSYIAFGKESGWINGYANNTFEPNKIINRAEAVKMMNGALGRAADKNKIDALVGSNQAGATGFPDVTKDFWAYYDIMDASILGARL